MRKRKTESATRIAVTAKATSAVRSRVVARSGGRVIGGRERKNRIEYFVTCVGDFADKRAMTPSAAFDFLLKYKGLEFLSECYDIEHTQSIEDSVSDAEDVCRRHGGVFV